VFVITSNYSPSFETKIFANFNRWYEIDQKCNFEPNPLQHDTLMYKDEMRQTMCTDENPKNETHHQR